jgi:hypothetical protein
MTRPDPPADQPTPELSSGPSRQPSALAELTEQDVRRALEASVSDVVPPLEAPAGPRSGTAGPGAHTAAGTQPGSQPGSQPALAAGLAERARARAGRIRSRRRATGSVLAAAAVVAAVVVGLPALTDGDGSIPGGPAAPQPTMEPTMQPTTQPTTPADACADNPCTAAEVVAGIRKPLDLPSVGPGEACPVSPTRRFAPGAGFTGPIEAVGAGPVYVAAGSSAIRMSPGQDGSAAGSGWLEQKVIWVVDRSYVGGLLLRGGRIDGPGEIRFLHYLGAVGYTDGAGDGKRHPELAYVRGGLSAAGSDTLSSYPSGIFVDEPGCYAVQVDGVGFSETLVFRALAP